MAAPSIYHPFQVTERDAKDRCLIVTERHMLDNHGRTRSSDYLFVMRCWTRAELHSSLRGFGTVAYFGVQRRRRGREHGPNHSGGSTVERCDPLDDARRV